MCGTGQLLGKDNQLTSPPAVAMTASAQNVAVLRGPPVEMCGDTDGYRRRSVQV